ncbi:U3 small nucleolar RNA-associated protein 6-domain-containing protein [Zychaea mexicana]|uniref:U3 small nucleolar RNA-associated protein 6-domain-containing protein n=1 Tax=Zychaea mexicana TaxID=64656 RepID=UPI0022FE9F1C|nr:U3 small nucleolar RNA-associated protein 6-domain-containing protein [Zychaea mexicana]KAI9488103.1 U3 small nucleolar RNA-associated protein 6-domain-containing protein [Zychaea mexicana]
MAETVQYRLERMVPELEEFERKGLFSKTEIKAIIKKRTNFEYAIARRIVKKIDFLRYIEYEMNLDMLRKKRKALLPNNDDDKTRVSEYSIKQRINGLFKRALIKFNGDVSLWMQYIDHAKRSKANNVLSGIFVSALQYHPRKPELWILAASWEFEDNANPAAARVLMQRALRLNPDSESLWHEYFRLELLYVEKIKMRRRLLGVDEKSLEQQKKEEEQRAMEVDESDENTIRLPTITGEDMENWNEESDERKTVKKMEASTAEALKEGVNPILNGLLAKIIYDNAIEAIPKELDFRTKFVDIYRMFSESELGIDHVLETILRDMQSNPAARSYLAQRHLFSKVKQTSENDTSRYIGTGEPEFIPAIKACVEDFNQAVQEVPTAEMFERYTQFLLEQHNFTFEENLKLYLSKVLQRAFKVARKMDVSSATLCKNHIDSLLEYDEDKAQSVVTKSVQQYPNSSDLWLMKITLCSKDDEDELFQQALKNCPESYGLWDFFTTCLGNRWNTAVAMKKQQDAGEELDKLYMRAAEQVTMLLPSLSTAAPDDRNRIKDLVLCSYVRWSKEAKGVVGARAVYKRIIQSLYPTYGFYQTCLAIEKEEQDSEPVEYLYEMATRLDNHKEEIYQMYISYLREQKKFKKADHVLWKATKEVPEFQIDNQ